MKELIIKVIEEKTDIDGNAPIADRPQELVRCKVCRNYNGFSCENMKNEQMIGMLVADEWFCADG